MVDLGLEARAVATAPPLGVPIAARVWLIVDESVQVGDIEMPHLISGLRRIAERMSAALCACDEDLVFVLDHLWFPLTDYQDDALELAVVGWAADRLRVEIEPAEITFDRCRNTYEIQYNEEIWDVER